MFFQVGIRPRELVVFSRQFAILISSGIPIIQSLSALESQTPNKSLRKIIRSIREDIERGVSPSQAFAKYPKIFSSLYSKMIEAGEMTGELSKMLSRIADYMESMEENIRKIKASLRYPLSVALMGGGLALFLLLYVLPQIERLYRESLSVELPAFSKFALGATSGIRESWPWVALAIGIGLIIYSWLKSRRKGQYLLDCIKLKIPIFKDIYHRILLARVSKTISTLLAGGIPILDALDMGARISGNMVMERGLDQARDSVQRGERIADSLKKCKLFPPLVISMIASGEESGTIPDMLDKIASFYEQDVKIMIDSLASLLEPILVGCLGAVIAFVVVSMYLPYFTMFMHLSR